jgi:hypothetical protein
MFRESQHERDGIINNSSTYPLVLRPVEGRATIFSHEDREA